MIKGSAIFTVIYALSGDYNHSKYFCFKYTWFYSAFVYDTFTYNLLLTKWKDKYYDAIS